MTASPKISLRGVTKSFGTKAVLRGIDLDVAAGESVVVIGGSGTGKSVSPMRALSRSTARRRPGSATPSATT
jgi:ABC-type transporter Mla maintaining outer membrane lipid asymmetry ATPase subunit MlaF